MQAPDDWFKVKLLDASYGRHDVVLRTDGRVELVCEHGVGHPSAKLQRRKWRDTDGVHGCDGCCSLSWFADTEDLILAGRGKTK